MNPIRWNNRGPIGSVLLLTGLSLLPVHPAAQDDAVDVRVVPAVERGEAVGAEAPGERSGRAAPRVERRALPSRGALPTPDTALTPRASALEATLGARHPGRIFYSGRAFAPLWITASGMPGPAAAALVNALRRADAHALPEGRYGRERLEAMIAELSPGSAGDAARLEVALTDAFLSYGADLAGGFVDPRRVDDAIKRARPRPSPAALLDGMAAAHDPVAFLHSLAPRDPAYARLKRRYAEVRSGLSDWGPGISSGPTMKPGTRSARVEAVRRRLAAMGDLEGMGQALAAGDRVVVAANDVVTDVPTGASDPALYDEALASAVRRFQARHGLNQDGLVGPATLEALNRAPAFRARQIAVNLERMRWMNRDLGERHVMVNLPGYRMALVENGRETFTSRVVVGKRRHATPEFSDEIEHMVVNPTWYVPNSIRDNEILPKLERNPNYLAERNMYMTEGGRVRQGPGPGNALGRVKFMFPNDYAIYLHDTPSRSLFARDMRAYSHGCVRVQEPYAFAARLLEDKYDQPRATFERWKDSGRERYVHLDRPVPVHLIYRTAWVDEDGRDQFRGDIYGRDAALAEAMEAAGARIAAR